MSILNNFDVLGLAERHSMWFIAFRNQGPDSLENFMQPQAEAWFQKMRTEQFQPRVTTYNRHLYLRVKARIHMISGWLFQKVFRILNPRHGMILNDEGIYFRRVEMETTNQIKHRGRSCCFFSEILMVPLDEVR